MKLFKTVLVLTLVIFVHVVHGGEDIENETFDSVSTRQIRQISTTVITSVMQEFCI